MAMKTRNGVVGFFKIGVMLFLCLQLLAVPIHAIAAELVIGVPVAESGVFSFVGVAVRNGLQVALNEINSKNYLGNTKLKVLVEDTQSDKNQAITLCNRFSIRDNALIVLGPTSTPESLAVAPISTENSIPFLTTASADISQSGDWMFKVTSTPKAIMEPLAKYAIEKLKVQKVGLVYLRDNDSYIAQMNGVKEHLVKTGVNIVAEETIVGSDTDFLAISTKLVAAKPDTIMISATAELSANVIIQVRQAGIPNNVRFLGTPSLASQQFLIVGGKAVEGTIYVADYSSGGKNQFNQNFVAAFQAKHNQVPDNWAAVGYTQMWLAAQAIKNAGQEPTRKKVRDELIALKNIDTVLGEGKYSFDGKRTPVYGGFIMTVKDGKHTPLE
jgi:branched-chain amino acid transport system substrate-binding protein